MNQLLSKISTTSVIAVVLLIGTIGYCFLSHLAPSHAKDTTDTQIVQGLFGALMLMLGYFFGSMKHRPVEQSANTINNA